MTPEIDIVAEAIKARSAAQAPYSNFQVGAALQTLEGTVILGANVESASYGLSCCAERVAIFKAVTDGHLNFQKLAIASEGGAAPCGACRQIIAEYAPDTEIILIDALNLNAPRTTRIDALLPDAFAGNSLPSN